MSKETHSTSLTKKRTANLSLVACFIIGMLLWLGSPVGKYDNIWSDFLLTCQSKPTSQKVILVAISPEDVLAHGQERLSRKFLADSLQQLNDAGVQRILLDFTLASFQTKEEASVLNEALSRFGPNRLAIADDQEANQNDTNNLSRHFTYLDLSFTIDQDGRIRTLSHLQPNRGASPYAWLHNGTLEYDATILDRRLDPLSIPKINLSQLEQGEYPANFFQNKLVVLGYDRQLSKTRAHLPVHGSVDRGTVIALATESRFENYNQQVLQAELISMAANIVFALCSYLIGTQAPHLSRALFALLTLAVLGIALSWSLTVFYGVPTRPATILLTSQISLGLAFAYRLCILELLGGLLSGVQSPEEVWLWRIHSDRETPVVLFDPMGHIKKANRHAVAAFQINPTLKDQQISELAFQCIPKLGERSTCIHYENSSLKTWEIEWPSSTLLLAVFHDATTQQAELKRLKSQLYTDPLTGEGNRASFEKTLASLDKTKYTSFSIFFMDMNGFKAVNDTYGHEAGDILLKIAAQRFRSVIGPNAFLARLGGDEFAIIVHDFQNENQLLDLRSNLEACLRDEIDIGHFSVTVGVAAGYAQCQSIDEDSASVLRRADQEMYKRKSILKSRISNPGSFGGLKTTTNTAC